MNQKKERRLLHRVAHDEKLFARISITPALISLLALMAFPLLCVVIYSFTKWDGVNATFIGFQNYKDLFENRDFWLIVGNNLLYLLIVPCILLLSLITAVLIYEEIKGWKFFRAVFFLPYVISAVVVGYLFRGMFTYDGIVNSILRTLHLDALAIDWLASRGSGIAVLVIAVTWTQFGYAMLVYLAGMGSVSTSVIEAARLDGAGWWARLRYIWLPLLHRTTEYLTILYVILAFNSLFDFVFTITNGGPGYDTMPISYWIYTKAFRNSEMGFACAVAVVLFIVTLAVNLLQRHSAKSKGDWNE